MSPARNLAREQKETSIRIMVDFDLCAGALEGGQREPKKNKPRNHAGTGSSIEGRHLWTGSNYVQRPLSTRATAEPKS